MVMFQCVEKLMSGNRKEGFWGLCVEINCAVITGDN